MSIKNLTIIIVLWSVISCQDEVKPSLTKTTITENKNIEVPLSFANNFSVKKEGELTILTINTPWQKATEKIEYVLYPKQKDAPTTYPNATKVGVPVSKIICTSTIDIAFLDALGATDKIIAISNGRFVYNPKIRAALASNQILEIGGNNAIDYEKALTTQADMAMVYSIGAEQSYKKFNELGIPTVLMSDFMETSPLGRAEWLLFVSYFLGLESEAQVLFKEISSQYNHIKKQASSHTYKPTVLTGAVYKGTWHVAGGKSLMAKLIEDAGGNYLWADNQDVSGIPLDFEAVYAKAIDADYWFNVSYYKTKKEVLEADTRYQDFKTLKNGNIFNHFKRMTEGGGSDVFESAIVKPHLLLNDFVQILHTPNTPADSLYYYIQLN